MHDFLISVASGLVTAGICAYLRKVWSNRPNEEDKEINHSQSELKKCNIQFWICLPLMTLIYLLRPSVHSQFAYVFLNVIFFVLFVLLWGAFDGTKEMAKFFVHTNNKDRVKSRHDTSPKQ